VCWRRACPAASTAHPRAPSLCALILGSAAWRLVCEPACACQKAGAEQCAIADACGVCSACARGWLSIPASRPCPPSSRSASSPLLLRSLAQPARAIRRQESVWFAERGHLGGGESWGWAGHLVQGCFTGRVCRGWAPLVCEYIYVSHIGRTMAA
jgi:hypothetical protein